MPPDTRYARSGDVHIAYQSFGEGGVDLVVVPGFISNVEHTWDEPGLARWLQRLARFARVITFDKRGTGLSDRTAELPTMEQRMDDVRAVMDAARSERAAVFGVSEGGSLAALFAATYPERCTALVLCGAFDRFAAWFTPEGLQRFFKYVETGWGTGASIRIYAPSRRNDPALEQWWARQERLGASPAAAAALVRMNSEIDITGALGAIRVPTLVIHRIGDMVVGVEGGRALAARIPGARLREFPGVDHLPHVGDNADEIADEIEEFITGARPKIDPDRVLATVLLTDIVDSTQRAGEMGDRGWRELLDRHDAVVRQLLRQFNGREVKTTGDGFLATFDGPTRAVRCAMAITDAVGRLGLAARAGLHTGEIELRGEDVGGIAVHIAARIAGLAGQGGVLASGTVRDLVAGSNLRFADCGTHKLKGLAEELRVFSVAKPEDAAAARTTA